jgi:putative transferase (TIGR04331 family)
MLFLGEWCRLYSRRHRWSTLDAVVLPYHWDDGEKFLSDSQFLLSLHEVLLAELSDHLNNHHGVDHSLRYWRILVGPWLGYFTQALFDRWESVQTAVTAQELSETIVLTGLEDARAPNDMGDYLYLRLGHGWNHHLYARILTDFTDVPCVRQPADGNDDPAGSETPLEITRFGLASKGKVKMVTAYSSLASRFTRPTDYLVTNTGLRSTREELDLQRRLGQVPRLVGVVLPVNVPANDRCRHWKLGEATGSGFDSYLRGLIPEQMPTAYLEGYDSLHEQVGCLRWPRHPKAIYTGASHFYDDVFKAWCAARTEDGAPLVIGQHGGHVGTAWSFSHDHQVAIADQFLSWGWSDSAEPKVVPVGMLKAPVLPETSSREKSWALLVSGNADLQSHELSSAARSGQYLDDLEDQFAFVEALPATVLDALLVRLSGHQCGWDQEQRWRDRLPEVSLDNGQRLIMGLLAETKLCIATNNGSTFLESFFLGVPTVIFWDRSRWKILDSAVPYFADLADVGIFHGTPESAARHVSSVWNDVQAWWCSDAVVDVVATFKRRYCDDPGSVLKEVQRILMDAAGEVAR